MTDTIPVQCACGKQFVVKVEHAGKRLRCKVCGAVLTIPAAEAIADPLPVRAVEPEPAPEPPPEEEAAAPAARPAARVSVREAGGFEAIDPGALLAGLGDTRFPRTLAVALILLAVLVGVTSIGFIRLCVTYKTLFPMERVAAEAKAAQEEKDKEEREKTLKKFQPPVAVKTEEAKPAADKPSGESKIEKELRETSDEKPKELTLDLGSPRGLE